MILSPFGILTSYSTFNEGGTELFFLDFTGLCNSSPILTQKRCKCKCLLISTFFTVLYYIFKWQIILNWASPVQSGCDYLIHELIHSLGKISTSSPGPGTEWLCPPQPSSTPAHASGRDHFKADSGAEVEARKQKGSSKK